VAEEIGADLNIVECSHGQQAQGKPRCILTFRIFFFYHKYSWCHVMCIRCEELDDTLVALW
jgi:hypothetical protein